MWAPLEGTDARGTQRLSVRKSSGKGPEVWQKAGSRLTGHTSEPPPYSCCHLSQQSETQWGLTILITVTPPGTHSCCLSPLQPQHQAQWGPVAHCRAKSHSFGTGDCVIRPHKEANSKTVRAVGFQPDPAGMPLHLSLQALGPLWPYMWLHKPAGALRGQSGSCLTLLPTVGQLMKQIPTSLLVPSLAWVGDLKYVPDSRLEESLPQG